MADYTPKPPKPDGDPKTDEAGPEPGEAPTEEPGIHNSRIVDRVRPDDDANEVLLVACQLRPWLAGAAGATELEEKLNAYFGYVLQGFLVQDYPQYEDRVVRLVVEVRDAPSPEIEAVLEQARSIARKNRLEFGVEAAAR